MRKKQEVWINLEVNVEGEIIQSQKGHFEDSIKFKLFLFWMNNFPFAYPLCD